MKVPLYSQRNSFVSPSPGTLKEKRKGKGHRKLYKLFVICIVFISKLSKSRQVWHQTVKKITISESISSNTKCDCTLTALLSQPISDFRENRRMKTRATEVLRKQRDLFYLCSSDELMSTFHFSCNWCSGKYLVILPKKVEVAIGSEVTAVLQMSETHTSATTRVASRK